MTYYEYIKNVATPEQIAIIFDNLENDSGYYTDANISAIACVVNNPDEYVKENNARSKKYSDDEDNWKFHNGYAYDKTIKFLNSKIEEE